MDDSTSPASRSARRLEEAARHLANLAAAAGDPADLVAQAEHVQHLAWDVRRYETVPGTRPDPFRPSVKVAYDRGHDVMHLDVWPLGVAPGFGEVAPGFRVEMERDGVTLRLTIGNPGRIVAVEQLAAMPEPGELDVPIVWRHLQAWDRPIEGWPERERWRAAAAALHNATRQLAQRTIEAERDMAINLEPARRALAVAQEKFAAVEAVAAGGAA